MAVRSSSIEESLLASFEMEGKHPRSVVVITIDEVYFQCARAVMRAELWKAETFADPASLPTTRHAAEGGEGRFRSGDL